MINCLMAFEYFRYLSPCSGYVNLGQKFGVHLRRHLRLYKVILYLYSESGSISIHPIFARCSPLCSKSSLLYWGSLHLEGHASCEFVADSANEAAFLCSTCCCCCCCWWWRRICSRICNSSFCEILLLCIPATETAAAAKTLFCSSSTART